MHFKETTEPIIRNVHRLFRIIILFIHLENLGCTLFAFDKERVHNAVEIDIFGLCIHRHQFAPPPPPPPKNYSGANDVISIDHVFVSSGSQVSHFASRVGVLACPKWSNASP